ILILTGAEGIPRQPRYLRRETIQAAWSFASISALPLRTSPRCASSSRATRRGDLTSERLRTVWRIRTRSASSKQPLRQCLLTADLALVESFGTGTPAATILAMEAWHSIRDAGHAIVRQLPEILAAIVVLGLFFTAGRLTLRFCQRIALVRGLSTNLGTVIGRLVQAALVMLGLLVGASIVLPSFHARDLIQILGIGGSAVGFAFRDVFQNFLSGILLLLAEPFRIGDEIEFAGQRGEVEDVQIRATLIRAADGRLILVPNTKRFVETGIVRPAPRPSKWSRLHRPAQPSGDTGVL